MTHKVGGKCTQDCPALSQGTYCADFVRDLLEQNLELETKGLMIGDALLSAEIEVTRLKAVNAKLQAELEDSDERYELQCKQTERYVQLLNSAEEDIRILLEEARRNKEP